MKVFKYVMKDRDNVFDIPFGGKVLSCQLQNELPAIWVLIDEQHTTTEKRKFFAYGTGYQIPFNKDQIKFIGTIQADNGIVHHIFEIIK